jgi:hypothetical protein
VPRGRRTLPGFVAKVFAWLVPAFVVGYLAAPVLLWPVALLAKIAATAGFPDLVRDTEQSAATLTFVTLLKPGDATSQAGWIAVEIDMLRYAYGLPLYAALTLAAREVGWPRRLVVGYAVLIPFVAFGVLADFLRNVAITAGAMVASQTGFVAWQREAIAFAFQLGSLILPTVAPAVAWVLLHRAFVERLKTQPSAG